MKVLGVNFHNLSLDEVIEGVDATICAGERKILAFSNPEFVVEAQKSSFLMGYLNDRVDINVADGVGVLWAASLSGSPLKERVTGTDFVPKLMELCVRRGYRVFFLGGKPGVAQRARDYLSVMLGKDAVVDVADGYFQADQSQEIIKKINMSGAQVLMVCLGNPRQEKWIEENLTSLNQNIIFGNGGALDFWSGNVKRAPQWMQTLGFEWLFRLGQDFTVVRIKRQLKLLEFVRLFLKSSFKK